MNVQINYEFAICVELFLSLELRDYAIILVKNKSANSAHKNNATSQSSATTWYIGNL